MTCYNNNDDFDVLIIADNFNLEIFPTTHKKSWAYVELGPFTLIDFCLEWVLWFNSPNVIVVTTTLNSEEIDKILLQWSSLYKNNLHIKNYPNCFNVNDLLRLVESQRLIKNDFILIDNIATFCSTNLTDYLLAFKSRLRQNRNNILTVLYSTIGSRDCPLLGIQNAFNKLILQNSVNETSIKIPKKLFISNTIFRSDLSPCGIALCARDFISHFAGNYDFYNFDCIIQDILSNEEFLGQNITVEIVQDISAFSANNYESLLKAKNLLIQRNCFPITFDHIFPYFKDYEKLLHVVDKNIYSPVGKEYSIKNSKNLKNSVFCKFSQISESAIVEWSTFGTSIKIGKNTKITNCIFGSSVQIGDNCIVEDSIFENNIIIENDCHIKRHCYIGTNVKILKNTIVEEGSVYKQDPSPEDMQNYIGETEASNWFISCDKVNDYYSWYLKKLSKNRRLSFWYLSSTSNALKSRQRNDSVKSCSSTVSKTSRRKSQQSLDDDLADINDDLNEANHVTSAYQGNIEQFFEEVLDLMSCLLQNENPNCSVDENYIKKMILEINTSRLKNNITVEDSNKNIFLAFLHVPKITETFSNLCKSFKNWKMLWENYYKSNISKLQMLHAIEDFGIEKKVFQQMLPNFIYFLYDEINFLSEELILEWYEGLPTNCSLQLLDKLKNFIIWLKESDDEDE